MEHKVHVGARVVVLAGFDEGELGYIIRKFSTYIYSVELDNYKGLYLSYGIKEFKVVD